MKPVPGQRHLTDPRREEGSAVVVALMAMMLMTALGMALVLTTSTETMVAANYRSGQEALYAAEAGLERALLEVPGMSDLDGVLGGSIVSTFTDGSTGERALPDGRRLNLTALTNVANCGRTAGCSLDQMNAVTAERPWGANSPRWRLFAYGPVNALLPAGQLNSPYYVVVWVGDDPAETDNDPTRDDAAGAGSPGRGVIVLRAEAFGPHGSHKRIEVAVQRPVPESPDNGYSGQRGQDEQNRRYRTAAVQTPGQQLTEMRMNLTTGAMVVQ
ncbi:MAG: pilus assembly PilX N-terminal domain-containing protein [Acidobacteriota bacterium]